MTAGTVPAVHAPARTLEGADAFTWVLPACWDADVRRRHADWADDDELWWLSLDHGAIDPAEVLTTTTRADVTCSDCLEWLHA